MTIYSADFSMLIAILPPGGFFVLAFLIAIKNAMDNMGKWMRDRKNRINSINI